MFKSRNILCPKMNVYYEKMHPTCSELHSKLVFVFSVPFASRFKKPLSYTTNSFLTEQTIFLLTPLSLYLWHNLPTSPIWFLAIFFAELSHPGA